MLQVERAWRGTLAGDDTGTGRRRAVGRQHEVAGREPATAAACSGRRAAGGGGGTTTGVV